MSYNLKIPNMIEAIIKNGDYPINLPNDSGFTIATKHNINSDDILFFQIKSFLNKDIILRTDDKIKGLFVGILLNGQMNYKDNILNTKEQLKTNDIKITYYNEFDSTAILDCNYHGIGLYINNNFLEKNFAKLMETHQKEFEILPSVTLKNQLSKNIPLAKELYDCPFTGELQNIYLQSKVLELIYHEFLEIMNPNGQNTTKKVKLTKDDIERLHLAKKIIIDEKSFPDLATLSKRCAINEFKLKYGFKELFNTTIYQMILEQKMTYARYLLETSEFSVQEISNFVGYRHQQSFTNAFVSFYKLPPKEFIKNRKYYY